LLLAAWNGELYPLPPVSQIDFDVRSFDVVRYRPYVDGCPPLNVD